MPKKYCTRLFNNVVAKAIGACAVGAVLGGGSQLVAEWAFSRDIVVVGINSETSLLPEDDVQIENAQDVPDLVGPNLLYRVALVQAPGWPKF